MAARKVGLGTVVATGAGLAMATVSYTANMQIGGLMGGASGWIAIALAGVISWVASWCFAELVSLFPTAAGIRLFIEKAFGERAALILASLYVTVTVSVVGAETFVLSRVLAAVIPSVRPEVWAVSFLGLLCLVNLRGITLSGRTQQVTTFGMFGALCALSLYALWRHPTPPILPETIDLSLPQAVALGIFLYLGFEWVTPLAEEVDDIRLLRRGMSGAILLLGVGYCLFHVAMLAVVGFNQTAAPQMLFGQLLLGRTGLLMMAGLSVLASITTFNAGLLTASRFVYAMSRDGVLPPWLSRLHATWATPWAAVLLLFVASLLLSLTVLYTGWFQTLIYMGAATECLIYVVMAAAVLRLRRLMPERPRPLRAPGGNFVPWLVIAVYSILFALLWVPDPAHTEALPAQIAAAGALVCGTGLIAAWVWWGVPRLRARQAGARQGPRRRPK